MKLFKGILALTLVSLLLAATAPASGQTPIEVTIVYGPIPRPPIIAMVNGWYEEEMNKVRPVKINWKFFEFGPPMLAAIASNAVDLTTTVGAGPTITAIEAGVDLSIIFPLSGNGRTEGVAARGSIRSPADLKGKTLGLPFGTTAHLSTTLALKAHGLSPTDVKMVDFRPSDLVAAWRRGDLDAAACWSPFFVQLLEAGGHEIWTDVDVRTHYGFQIADVMLARGGLKRQYPELVEAFVRATIRAYQFRESHSEEAYQIMAKRLNQPVELVRNVNARFIYPPVKDLLSSEWTGSGFNKSLLTTAEFLNQLGRIRTLKKDYTPWTDWSFIQKVLESSAK